MSFSSSYSTLPPQPLSPKSYVAQLNQKRHDLSQIPTSVLSPRIPSPPPPQPTYGYGRKRKHGENQPVLADPVSSAEGGILARPRVKRLLKSIATILEDCENNPTNPKWAHLNDLLKMACTRGMYRWADALPEVMPPPPVPAGEGVKYILAETEEEWFEWERKRAKERKVREWMDKLVPTPVGVDVDDVADFPNPDADALEDGLGHKEDEVASSGRAEPRVVATAARDDNDISCPVTLTLAPKPAPTKLSQPKTSSQLSMSHSQSQSRLDLRVVKKKTCPVPKLKRRPTTGGTPTPPPPPPLPATKIHDLRDTTFLPPTFQSQLANSTPPLKRVPIPPIEHAAVLPLLTPPSPALTNPSSEGDNGKRKKKISQPVDGIPDDSDADDEAEDSVAGSVRRSPRLSRKKKHQNQEADDASVVEIEASRPNKKAKITHDVVPAKSNTTISKPNTKSNVPPTSTPPPPTSSLAAAPITPAQTPRRAGGAVPTLTELLASRNGSRRRTPGVVVEERRAQNQRGEGVVKVLDLRRTPVAKDGQEEQSSTPNPMPAPQVKPKVATAKEKTKEKRDDEARIAQPSTPAKKPPPPPTNTSAGAQWWTPTRFGFPHPKEASDEVPAQQDEEDEEEEEAIPAPTSSELQPPTSSAAEVAQIVSTDSAQASPAPSTPSRPARPIRQHQRQEVPAAAAKRSHLEDPPAFTQGQSQFSPQFHSPGMPHHLDSEGDLYRYSGFLQGEIVGHGQGASEGLSAIGDREDDVDPDVDGREGGGSGSKGLQIHSTVGTLGSCETRRLGAGTGTGTWNETPVASGAHEQDYDPPASVADIDEDAERDERGFGGFGMYNSQLDVERSVRKVDELLGRDVGWDLDEEVEHQVQQGEEEGEEGGFRMREWVHDDD